VYTRIPRARQNGLPESTGADAAVMGSDGLVLGGLPDQLDSSILDGLALIVDRVGDTLRTVLERRARTAGDHLLRRSLRPGWPSPFASRVALRVSSSYVQGQERNTRIIGIDI
jgi:hypothetical protein